ncbi:hypothetical protein P1P75_16315 [Streptomyces sp. ID05-39B]|nr:hypothetical protein [Streptomyces sp. ID05-39B]MDX3527957.1 hypothetical protein [Streptomyces sp. ID05-39B]
MTGRPWPAHDLIPRPESQEALRELSAVLKKWGYFFGAAGP